MALSMDARCSRVMEKLLKACTDDDLVRYLAGVTKEPSDFFTMCKSLFGSRVAEFALGCVATRVGKHPDASLLEKLDAPLRAVSDAITAAAVDCAYDPRVSPVARKFLSLLSGRECSPSSKAAGLAGKLKGGTSAAGSFADAADAPPERHKFDALLNAFSDATLAALEPELWNLTEDACGSAFLQALLNAHKGDVASLNWIIPGYLGCAPAEGTKEGELLADAKESDVKQLVESRSGSHLFEAIIRAAPGVYSARFSGDFSAGRCAPSPGIPPPTSSSRRSSAPHETATTSTPPCKSSDRTSARCFANAAPASSPPSSPRARALRSGEREAAKISPGDSPRRWRRGRKVDRSSRPRCCGWTSTVVSRGTVQRARRGDAADFAQVPARCRAAIRRISRRAPRRERRRRRRATRGAPAR